MCGAVCVNRFEKCTYCFESVKNDSRNVPKRLRKTGKEVPMGWGQCGLNVERERERERERKRKGGWECP